MSNGFDSKGPFVLYSSLTFVFVPMKRKKKNTTSDAQLKRKQKSLDDAILGVSFTSILKHKQALANTNSSALEATKPAEEPSFSEEEEEPLLTEEDRPLIEASMRRTIKLEDIL
jgi:hypothetical protein